MGMIAVAIVLAAVCFYLFSSFVSWLGGGGFSCRWWLD